MKRFIQNTIYQYMNYVWMILVGLLLPPLIIHHIGLREFGVWALLTAVIRYFELLDFGIETTLVKHISEYQSNKETGAVNTLASSAILVQVALFVTITLFTLLILSSLSEKGYLEATSKYAIFIAVVSGAGKNIFLVYRGVLTGLQKMKISNTIEVLATLPYLLFVILILNRGGGVNELITCYMFMTWLSGTVMIITVKRIFPKCEISFFQANRDDLKKLFRFGGKLQISRLSQLASFQLDKLLIALFLNVTYVGIYDLGAKITTIMRNFPLIMVSAVTPAVSELKARGLSDQVEKFYKNGTLCLVSAGLPLLLFSAVFAHEIIHAWIGRPIPEAAMVVKVLSVGYFFNMSTGMASGTSIGMGRPDVDMRAGILTTLLNPLMSLTCLIFFGFQGALFATSFSLTVGAIYLFYIFNSVISEPFSACLKRFSLPLISAVTALLMVKTGAELLFSGPFSTPFEVRIFIVIAALFYCILYWLILSRTGHLDNIGNRLSGKWRYP